MATVLRLARRYRKHKPFYHLVATDSRNANGGAFIERIGFYDPLGETSLRVDADKAKKWLATGAKPSDTVKSLLKRAGVLGNAAAAAPAAKGEAHVGS